MKENIDNNSNKIKKMIKNINKNWNNGERIAIILILKKEKHIDKDKMLKIEKMNCVESNINKMVNKGDKNNMNTFYKIKIR